MDNSTLVQSPLPIFSAILPEHIEPELKKIISENRAALTRLLNHRTYTWNSLMMPLEEINDKLSKFWAPISHLHSVAETKALRDAYNHCLPLLTEYHTEMMHNESLHQAIQSIADSDEYAKLNTAQQKVIDNELRDFRLAGVGLPPEKKTRFAKLQKELSLAMAKFSENILDATQAWTYHTTDANELKGLNSQTLQLLTENAKQSGKKGWVITLDHPCYTAVIKHVDNPSLRKLLYEAYVTRASDQGPNAGKFENTKLMEKILKMRFELAALLGFKNYADYSLSTKMTDTSQQVMDFLNDLIKTAKKIAKHEFRELTEFAKKTDGIEKLESWDIAYYSEKLRGKKFTLQDEDLRPYFPINKVLQGMFEVVNKLYGIKIIERTGINTWNDTVLFFDILSEENKLVGSLYIDLYARPHKRDGAWMDECQVRRQLANGHIQHPVAFLTCNFNRPLANKPALLTHDDVLTIFHEFGHCLHHLLTKINYAPVSGINGVPWDAVELPSQFMENWCWEKETLALISQHVDTGKPLPDDMYQKLIAARNFQTGLYILRQLEFAIFDFRLHLEFNPTEPNQIQRLLDEVRDQISVFKTPSFNRFQHSFSHIFAGSYAAGYYSYLWAEVLSSDAYSKFEETGIFNPATGREFLNHILEQGGSKHPMDLFVAFRGRKPTIDALLRHYGLVGET